MKRFWWWYAGWLVAGLALGLYQYSLLIHHFSGTPLVHDILPRTHRFFALDRMMFLGGLMVAVVWLAIVIFGPKSIRKKRKKEFLLVAATWVFPSMWFLFVELGFLRVQAPYAFFMLENLWFDGFIVLIYLLVKADPSGKSSIS